MSWLTDKLKSIDAFPKALDDFRVKTSTGGVVSIISMTLMMMLLVSELVYYMRPKTVDHLFVASNAQNTLRVVFDVTFPSISCNLISIDAVDDMGKPIEGSWHDIFKHSITDEGIYILDIFIGIINIISFMIIFLKQIGSPSGEASKMVLGNTMKSEEDIKSLAQKHKSKLDKGEIICGNCYGALVNKCCNTCESGKN